MSRCRESFQPAIDVTTDDLLTAQYGPAVVRVAHRPMSGCSACCCHAAPVIDLDVLIWRATVRVLTSDAATVVCVLAVLCLIWRVIGGGR